MRGIIRQGIKCRQKYRKTEKQKKNKLELQRERQAQRKLGTDKIKKER